MTDNTKVNSYQEWLLDAIEITAEQLIQGLSYDKTIVCTVVDDSKKEQDEYKVFDGSSKFTAYAVGAKYKNGDSVYVNVPQGDFINDKFITGKQNNKIQVAYNYVEPFDKIIDLSGNINSKLEEVGLIANGEDNIKEIAIIKLDEPIKSMTWLGLKADFRSMVSEAVFGSYGLKLELSPANGEKKCVLDSSSMFGNPYNFTTSSNQQMIYPIQNIDEIEEIRIYFYQNNNFTNIKGESIQVAEGSPDNLFVSNIYLCYGKDSSEITEDVVELISVEGTTYENEGEQKNINLRWIHKDGDKAYIVKADEHSELLEDYDIQWYRFALGAPAPDDWTGIYWQKIAAADKSAESPIGVSSNQLSCSFKTGNGKQERIKAIVYEKGDSYDATENPNDKFVKVRSKELFYNNTKGELSNTEYNSILEIECMDGTNGNYIMYNQSGDLLDITQDDKLRELQLKINIDGEYEPVSLNTGDSILWKFPESNSMIVSDTAPTYKTWDNKDLLLYYKYWNKDTEDGDEYEVELKSDEKFDTYIYKSPWTEESEPIGQVIDGIYYSQYSTFPSDCEYLEYMYSKLYHNNKEVIKYSSDKGVWLFYKEGFNPIGYVTREQNGKITGYYLNNNDQIIPEEKNNRLYYGEQAIDVLAIKNSNNQDQIYNAHFGIQTIKHTSTQLKPTYRIGQRYSVGASNNTVTCILTLGGKQYVTAKEFTFAPQGTMGTKYTMLVDFVGNENAIMINNNKEYKLKLQIYDEFNQELKDDTSTYTWSLKEYKYNGEQKEENIIPSYKIFNNNGQALYKIEKGGKEIVLMTGDDYFKNMDELFIIKVTQDSTGMTTYFPLPLRSDDKYQNIYGATKVIYGSDGKPQYSKEGYKIQYIDETNNNELKLLKTVMGIVPNGQAEFGGTQNDVLQPSSLYSASESVYGVQFKLNNEIIWTQPILVIQNTYPSTTINSWDGETLTVDTENGTILGTALAMGTKNHENQFTGVMLGDWQDKSDGSLALSGLYGFKDGSQAFAFKEDGTAFIGAGNGRINFDGNEATIYGEDYKDYDQIRYNKSMTIDLNDLKIKMETLYKDKEGKDQSKVIDIGFNTTNGMLTPYISLNGDASKSTYPLQVGSNFKVDWDGSIDASSGWIGYWKISADDNQTLQSSGGEIVLDAVNKEITVGSGGSIKATVGGRIEATRLISDDKNAIISLGSKVEDDTTYSAVIEMYPSAPGGNITQVNNLGRIGYTADGDLKFWTSQGGDTLDSDMVAASGFKGYFLLKQDEIQFGCQEWKNGGWSPISYEVNFNGATLINCTVNAVFG